MALARRLAQRKFDHIPDEARDDLVQEERVADELVGNVRVNVVGEVEIVLGRAYDECTTSVRRAP